MQPIPRLLIQKKKKKKRRRRRKETKAKEKKRRKKKKKEKKREKKVSWDMFAAFHFDVLEVWVCSLSLKPALFHGHLQSLK